MIIGLSLDTFVIVHVVISFVAIATGLVVVYGMFGGQRMPGWTALFLATTILTSVTGFLFPITAFTPALGTGAISMVLLAVAVFALYGGRLRGAWRWVYVATAVSALYLNVFVLIVQSFQKVPIINALAPTQAEPPFLIVQGAALVLFAALGTLASSRFRPAADLPIAR